MSKLNNQQTTKNHSSSESIYLKNLEFKPELRKTWFSFFVKNFRVVILLILILGGWGTYSYLQLPRESMPEVKIPVAVITAGYPGASPGDIEELVTKKIETGISGVSGINKVTSESFNSVSSVVVEFNSREDIDNAVRKLRDKLPSIKAALPEDASDPEVMEISLDDSPVLIFELTGPYDDFTLRQYAEKTKDDLEAISGVREVKVVGGDEKEFRVNYDPEKLASYGLNVAQVNQIISSANLTIPVGNFDGESYSYPIRTDSRFYNTKSIGGIPLSHNQNGALIYVKDLATVEEAAIKRTTIARFSQNGQPPQNTVEIQIIKRTGASIITTIEEVNAVLDKQAINFPPNMSFVTIINMADTIQQDFNQLGRDFIITLLLVVTVLFLLVGLKEAFVAGLAIPLVFFFTFGVMHLTGTSLNFLSIFALLLSLGLLVDDAIVVVSATKQYMRTGKFTPEEAVLLVLRDFKAVLTTTTLATIWAFLPLLLTTGIMGEFIKSIPITVSVILASSFLVAIFISPSLTAVLERVRLTRGTVFSFASILALVGFFALSKHTFLGFSIAALTLLGSFVILWWYFFRGQALLKKNKALVNAESKDDNLIKKRLFAQNNPKQNNFWEKLFHGAIHFDQVIPIYEKYLRKITATAKRRHLFMTAVALLFIVAIYLPASGIIKSEFFPPMNGEEIYIDMRAPAGLILEESDKIVKKIEERLYHYPEIKNFSTTVGSGGINSFNTIQNNSSNKANITIKLCPPGERKKTSHEIASQIREDIKSISDATITVSTPQGGPPTGYAFQAQISGDNLQTLEKIANELKLYLDEVPGVLNSDISLKESPAEYTFHLNHAKMELYGINAGLVGSTLRTAIAGTKITTVIEDNKDVNVTAYFEENKTADLHSIQNMQIANFAGQLVYLKDIAEVELTPTVESIKHLNQKRTVLLTADAAATTNSNEILKKFTSRIKSDYSLPAGYEISYGGENEENASSVRSIFKAMTVAVALILSTMIIQFNSFRQALIILITMPLALIGTFFGFALFGINLSFPGLIGVLALFGIVVKNAIILVDKMNINLKSGIPFYESVIDAGKSRLEAIFITSFCTILGLIPITFSDDIWRALGSAVIFGLMFSSFLTLFLVPVLFISLMGSKDKSQKP
ncbi:MAG TPA: efflux RND transporter permease subunit [Candidatus Moranbacteria bacterium]|nr:efflux RND transporter permease subunit [Candidatus Moranbacteria bacterium]